MSSVHSMPELVGQVATLETSMTFNTAFMELFPGRFIIWGGRVLPS
jgi:hypothetical protein